jgi:hypothetical protein
MDFVVKHPEYPWNWDGISLNENLTMDYVERHPEHPWDWYEISQNKTLNIDYVEQHSEYPWNWYEISINCFEKEKTQFIEKKYKEHLSAFKIQQWFHHIKYNPNYSYYRKRVNIFYDKYL